MPSAAQFSASEPIAHRGHYQGHKAEGWRVVIGPGVVPDAPVYSIIWVPGSFAAEFPYGPVVAMLLVEEGDKPVERIAVGPLRVCLRRPGSANWDFIL